MKRPSEFDYVKWMSIASTKANTNEEVQPHWLTKTQIMEKFNKGNTQAGQIIRKFIKEGLLIRHLVKNNAYFEPVVPEEIKK